MVAAPGRRGAWVAKLMVLAASVAFAAVLMEAYVRVSGRDQPLIWQPDPVLGWRHIPLARGHWHQEGEGWIEINSLGMRDPERTIAKPPGDFRIAVFGDSMTEADQVNPTQTYCQLLESRLRNEGLQAEVLNFGVTGYSPLQEYLLYKHVGKDFAPDLVLHAVFLDNDIADGDPDLSAVEAKGPYVLPSSSAGLTIDYSRAEQSNLDYHREPFHAMRRFLATYRMMSAARWGRIDQDTFQNAVASGAGIPKRHLLYKDPEPPKWQEAWSTFERIESAFAAEVRASGSAFAVVSVPAGQLVNDTAWSQLLEQYPAMKPVHWDLPAPEAHLREIAAKHGVPLIAPLEKFREQRSTEPLFFGGLGHLTVRGHEVMAAAMEAGLRAHGLIPAVAASARR